MDYSIRLMAAIAFRVAYAILAASCRRAGLVGGLLAWMGGRGCRVGATGLSAMRLVSCWRRGLGVA